MARFLAQFSFLGDPQPFAARENAMHFLGPESLQLSWAAKPRATAKGSFFSSILTSKRKKGRRKGLDPLVATMLMVAFAIAVGALILNWVTGFSEEKKELSEQQTEDISQCLGLSLEIQKVYSDSEKKISKIDVQNTGTKELRLDELMIVGTNSSCISTFGNQNGTLAVGQLKTIFVQNCNVNCNTYQGMTLDTLCKDISSVHLKNEKVLGC